ncbi:MAG: site-specific tyrosine recombinase/integron integrase [bacterium]
MQENIQSFLKFLDTEKGYADNTIAAYRNDLTQFLRYLEGKDEISSWAQVDKDTVIRYVLNLKEREYTSSTVARKVAAIKSFFHYLMAEKVVADDPTATLDSPKVKKRLPKAISREDIEQLLAAPAQGTSAKSQRDHALLELLYASGMRVTELVSLDVSDVNLASGSVRVRGKKTSSKERIIPVGDRALDALQVYVNKGRMQLVRDPEEPALFLNHRGQRLTRQGLWLIIKHYVDEVGISEDVTPHTLRHSFAAHKLSQGKSLQDIQKLLGHANISTTQVYQHVGQEPET